MAFHETFKTLKTSEEAKDHGFTGVHNVPGTQPACPDKKKEEMFLNVAPPNSAKEST